MAKTSTSPFDDLQGEWRVAMASARPCDRRTAFCARRSERLDVSELLRSAGGFTDLKPDGVSAWINPPSVGERIHDP